jgi:MSHA biogenesis protein MshP
MTHSPNPVRGFAIVAAIFLLVVLAALGAFMLHFSSIQQLTSAQDVQGSRAYWAARAGLEWAASKITTTPVCPTPPSPFTLDSFNLTVTCTSATHVEGSVTKTQFNVTSTATSGGSAGSIGYIDRSLSASLEM